MTKKELVRLVLDAITPSDMQRIQRRLEAEEEAKPVVFLAVLSMPNNNSGNNRWTGDSERYSLEYGRARKGTMRYTQLKALVGNYYYDFKDGWGANVEIRKAEKGEKPSRRFAGYEWMVSDIRIHGRICTREERHAEPELPEQKLIKKKLVEQAP